MIESNPNLTVRRNGVTRLARQAITSTDIEGFQWEFLKKVTHVMHFLFC